MATWWTRLTGGGRAQVTVRESADAEHARQAVRTVLSSSLLAQDRDAGRAVGRLLGGRKLKGRAQAIESETAYAFDKMTMAVLPPPDPWGDWRALHLDAQTFDKIDPLSLPGLLRSLSPETSKAIWDFLRFCNPGWESRVLTPGTQNPLDAGQRLHDAFLDRLSEQDGTPDVAFGQLFLSAFMRGAIAAELELDPAGRTPIDLIPLDPAVLRFRRRRAQRRTFWQLGQWQDGEWVDLDRPTIRYLPIDPMPGDPYGVPMMSAAPFVTVFLLVLLHDLRRVVQQQGYPRLDFTVNLVALQALMPAEIREHAERRGEWIKAAIDEIQTYYAGLQPEDAFVHTDAIEVNRPVGTVDDSSLGAIDGLLRGLERITTRALKTNVLLMVGTEGLSEASANRLWESHLQTIKSVQHLVETVCGRLFALALQAQGVAATVEHRFAENRASERLRDAQSEALEIQNEKAKFDMGLTTHDEMGMKLTGHPPVGPEPPREAERFEAEQEANQLKQLNPEPGADRAQPAGAQPVPTKPNGRVPDWPDGNPYRIERRPYP